MYFHSLIYLLFTYYLIIHLSIYSFATDINECSDNTICPQYSTCNNTAGSYECNCWENYVKYDGVCKGENVEIFMSIITHT